MVQVTGRGRINELSLRMNDSHFRVGTQIQWRLLPSQGLSFELHVFSKCYRYGTALNITKPPDQPTKKPKKTLGMYKQRALSCVLGDL